ncbi:MAG: hypothetical protein WDN25_09680 [Acetobacteraceae bacterium]
MLVDLVARHGLPDMAQQATQRDLRGLRPFFVGEVIQQRVGERYARSGAVKGSTIEFCFPRAPGLLGEVGLVSASAFKNADSADRPRM